VDTCDTLLLAATQLGCALVRRGCALRWGCLIGLLSCSQAFTFRCAGDGRLDVPGSVPHRSGPGVLFAPPLLECCCTLQNTWHWALDPRTGSARPAHRREHTETNTPYRSRAWHGDQHCGDKPGHARSGAGAASRGAPRRWARDSPAGRRGPRAPADGPATAAGSRPNTHHPGQPHDVGSGWRAGRRQPPRGIGPAPRRSPAA